MPCWSSTRPAFSSRARPPAASARQYTGSAGKITNCQIGVFAAYVSRHGHAFIDRALYLPKAWTDDPARLAAAHVPPGTAFATKPRLALAMIERAIAADVPFAWVAADSVYGVGEIEIALRRAGKGYVLGVNGTHPFNSWGDKPPVAGTAEEIAQASTLRPGRACRPVRAPRARGSTTGPIANWPISRPPNTTTAAPACGRAAS